MPQIRVDRMSDRLKPRDAKDVEDAVRWALDHGKTLELVGGGTKRAIGRPSQSDLTLDLSGLSGVTLYEPEELVLSAKAGTPVAEIEALLAAHGQELAFEPIDCGALLGTPADGGTIGGTLATNLCGPRRLKAGAARDHFLGVTAVSGRGETFKSGGRVVKNVTGYDLCKLLAGSWGTLAAMTDITVKVLPRAETAATVLVLGLDDATAVRAMTVAVGSPCDVSGAAHLPPAAAARTAIAAIAGATAVTGLRLEGFALSVNHRRSALESLLRPFGSLMTLDAQASDAFWRAVRDAAPFATSGDAGDRLLWRISVAPAQAAACGARITTNANARLMYDWGGGLIWAALATTEDAGADIVRGAVGGGGHATLIRAPATVRAAVDVFQPQAAAVAALSKRVKDGFDPRGVLNPGRMWAGV
jgi:glycolate oxidase FAD binding subunit